MKANKAGNKVATQPKATAKGKVAAKTAQKADATVTVPAALKAAVSTVADCRSASSSAIKRESQSWNDCAAVLNRLFKTKELAAPVLKQAFEDAKMGDKQFSSYRSNILTLAYPEEYGPKRKEELEQAKQDGLDVNKQLAVVRGTLKKSKKKDGGYVKIERQETRGGHNKVQPLDAFGKAMTVAFTAAQVGKLDEDQCATKIAEATDAAGLDVETLAKALQALAD